MAASGARYEACILHGSRPLDEAVRRVGMGFVVSPHHIVTCAHVVASALFPDKADFSRRRACATSPEKPAETVMVGLPLSRKAGKRAYAATVLEWEPSRPIDERDLPDDIALLYVAERLPDDIVPAAMAGLELRPGEVLCGFGISEAANKGKAFGGEYQGEVEGRSLLISDKNDLTVEKGCSGAAIHKPGDTIVCGMVTSLQGETTGLFIPSADLLAHSFLSQFTRGIAPAEDQARSAPARREGDGRRAGVGTRLQKRLYALDHVVACDGVFGVALYTPSVWIALCGGVNEDMAVSLHERLQMRFRRRVDRSPNSVENLRAAPDPEMDLRDLTISWPSARYRPQLRLAQMKGLLSDRLQLSGDGRSLNLMKAALEETAMCVYSEFRLTPDGVAVEDRSLLTDWAAFLASVGALGPTCALVHVVCILPPEGGPAPDEKAFNALLAELSAQVSAHLEAQGASDIILNQDTLKALDMAKVETWLRVNGPAVDLRESELDAFVADIGTRVRARTAAIPPQPVRLKDIATWLTPPQ